VPPAGAEVELRQHLLAVAHEEIGTLVERFIVAQGHVRGEGHTREGDERDPDERRA
jgi:hypothetical protein